MKRFLALAALVLGMVSCQTEPEGLDVIVGGAQDVTVTVAIPEAETRADADWSNSKKGAFENVDFTQYTIRYIFDVYYGEDRAERQVKYSDDQSVPFGVRLVPEREYSFVVWADVVAQREREENAWSNDDNAYYDTEYLTAVSLKPNAWVAMDETRDAFTGVHTETNYTGSSNITISLTRPFAKLRVVTTDFDELAKFDIKATYAKVEYTTPYVSKFNALEGEAVAAAENGPTKTHEYTIKSYADETGDEHTIFSDYIFTTDPGVVKFNMEVFEEDMTKRIKANSFNTDIQVRPNYITTLKGDVLTTGGNVTITVNPGFAQDEIVENYVDTAADLQNVIDNATDGQETVVVLGGDVDLSVLLGAGILSTRAAEPTFGLEIPAGKKLVLDLNGKRVYQTKACSAHYSMILNKGDLTITGEGTIEFENTSVGDGINWGTYTIENHGEAVLTIDNATIRHNGCVDGETEHYTNIAIQNYEGKVVINDGTIASPEFRSLRDFTAGGEIIINGGTFLGQVWMQGLGNGSSSLTITGGSFSPVAGYDGSSVYIANSANVVNVAITGGLFNTKVGCYDATKDGAKGCITAGTFTTAAKEATNEALINEDYTWVEAENGLWTLGLKPTVAKIGDVEYRSLQKAFDAGGEVTLLCDVNLAETVVLAEGKTATLDLNGKTIDVTYNESTSKHIYALDNYGTLTIKDSKGTGKIVARGMYNRDGAKLTINEAEVVGADWNGGACVWGYGTSELYLNNATLVGNTGCVSSEGYIEINGGTYTCYSGIDDNGAIITSPTFNIRAYNGLKITNGDFTSRHGVISIGGGEALLENGNYTIKFAATTTSNVVYIYGTANVDIKGGKYISDNSANKADSGAAVLVSGSDASLNIYDGEFVGMNGMVSGNATLYGGKYNTVWNYNHYDKLENLLAEGYKAEQDENGAWIVVVDPAAKIGDVEYATLQEAFNVGGEITLLRNVAVAETVVLAEGKTAVLDLNGYSISHNDEANKYAINNHGTLTIKDGNGNGSINARGIYNGYGNGGNNTATAKIIVESGTINAKGTNGGAAIFNYGVAEIKGGTFTSIGGYSLSNQQGSSMKVSAEVTANNGIYASEATLTVDGGQISGNRSGCHVVYCWNTTATINGGTYHNNNAGNATLMAAGSSVVTINGGTFSIADGRVPGNGNTWTSSMMDQNGTAQVIVKGGLFNGGFRINSATTTLTIEGGEFNTNNGSAFTDYSGTKVVRGGKFTDAGAQNWAKKYIAEGYEMDANGQVVAK